MTVREHLHIALRDIRELKRQLETFTRIDKKLDVIDNKVDAVLMQGVTISSVLTELEQEVEQLDLPQDKIDAVLAAVRGNIAKLRAAGGTTPSDQPVAGATTTQGR